MSSRDTILKAVAANKPDSSPELPDFVPLAIQDPVQAFEALLTSSGARVIHCQSREEVARHLATEWSDGKLVATAGVDVPGSIQVSTFEDDRKLAGVDLFACRGVVGVGENGAIWVTEKECVKRVAVFLPEHVALVVSRNAIVGTMVEAYASIKINDAGWGAFVAGPSKTADIEQSLVIGAHGPRSLTVYID